MPSELVQARFVRSMLLYIHLDVACLIDREDVITAAATSTTTVGLQVMWLLYEDVDGKGLLSELQIRPVCFRVYSLGSPLILSSTLLTELQLYMSEQSILIETCVNNWNSLYPYSLLGLLLAKDTMIRSFSEGNIHFGINPPACGKSRLNLDTIETQKGQMWFQCFPRNPHLA